MTDPAAVRSLSARVSMVDNEAPTALLPMPDRLAVGGVVLKRVGRFHCRHARRLLSTESRHPRRQLIGAGPWALLRYPYRLGVRLSASGASTPPGR